MNLIGQKTIPSDEASVQGVLQIDPFLLFWGKQSLNGQVQNLALIGFISMNSDSHVCANL